MERGRFHVDRGGRRALRRSAAPGLLGDAALFVALEGGAVADAAVIARAAAVKVRVVNADEREAGQRRCLNLGHTFGHALELGLSHGAAVAVGLAAAARLAHARGVLCEATALRIEGLLSARGMPVRPPRALAAEPLRAALRADKKRGGDVVRFVLPEDIGCVRVTPVVVEALVSFWLEFQAPTRRLP